MDEKREKRNSRARLGELDLAWDETGLKPLGKINIRETFTMTISKQPDALKNVYIQYKIADTVFFFFYIFFLPLDYGEVT